MLKRMIKFHKHLIIFPKKRPRPRRSEVVGKMSIFEGVRSMVYREVKTRSDAIIPWVIPVIIWIVVLIIIRVIKRSASSIL